MVVEVMLELMLEVTEGVMVAEVRLEVEVTEVAEVMLEVMELVRWSWWSW